MAEEDKIKHVIPAAPGTYLLWSGLDKGEFWVNRSNVIAWANVEGEEYGTLTPVTAEGINDGSGNVLPILYPDGRVCVVCQQDFESLGEWKTWAEEAARKQAE